MKAKRKGEISKDNTGSNTKANRSKKKQLKEHGYSLLNVDHLLKNFKDSLDFDNSQGLITNIFRTQSKDKNCLNTAGLNI